MPRLFTAVPIPELIRSQLSLLEAPLDGARWLDAEDMHLTLRFFGDVDNRTADEIVAFLDQIDFAPFEIEIDGLGAFGGREPRILHTSIKPCPALERLQRAHERTARAAGLAPETRSFKPHITLARLKGARAEAVAAFLSAQRPPAVWPFRVESFLLMSSRPGSGGPPYVAEEEFRARPFGSV